MNLRGVSGDVFALLGDGREFSEKSLLWIQKFQFESTLVRVPQMPGNVDAWSSLQGSADVTWNKTEDML